MAVKNLLNKHSNCACIEKTSQKKWMVYIFQFDEKNFVVGSVDIALCDTRREARNVKKALQEIHLFGGAPAPTKHRQPSSKWILSPSKWILDIK